MTPASRIAATIEIIEQMINFWQEGKSTPADRLLERYFKAHRFMGSKDRGSVAEGFYWLLRHLGSLEWWALGHYPGYVSLLKSRQGPIVPKLNARALVLAAIIFRREHSLEEMANLFDGGKYAPSPLTDGEWRFIRYLSQQSLISPSMPASAKLNFPEWLKPYLEASLHERLEFEMHAMSKQAPVHLRANTLKITRDMLLAALNQEGFEASPTPTSPIGIRLEKREAIFATQLFKDGMFEMQDEGSQIAGLLVDAQPGMRVIDFCAGAGGKTLCIAAQMENKGRLLAFDTSAPRLSDIPVRLRRAGVGNTQWRVISSENDSFLKRHKLSADRVLIDAPCSGVGTWRRNPDLKWRFKEEDLLQVISAQERILDSASRLVKVGGRLIYVTCSLLKNENEQQIERFLTKHNKFRVVCAKKVWNKESTFDTPEAPSYLWLSPHQDGTDGFFAAVLTRTAEDNQ